MGILGSGFTEISCLETSHGLKAILDLKKGQHSQHLTTEQEWGEIDPREPTNYLHWVPCMNCGALKFFG